MAGPPGHLYVYFSYGTHWCANVVCEPEGRAGAVLLRAVEPVAGLDVMRAARWRTQRRREDRDLCRGPGRLCQALGITGEANGSHLVGGGEPAPVTLRDDGGSGGDVVATPRIGVTRAADRPWRFALPGSPWTSGATLRPATRP